MFLGNGKQTLVYDFRWGRTFSGYDRVFSDRDRVPWYHTSAYTKPFYRQSSFGKDPVTTLVV
jgi:hypothetical protein